MDVLTAKPDSISPILYIMVPASKTFFGPNLSLNQPPVIMVIGPTEFATVYTIARSAEVMLCPVRLLRYSDIEAEKTLHA